MAEFPTQGQTPYGDALKAYIDETSAGRGDQSTGWADLGIGEGSPGILFGRRTGPWVTLALNPGFTAGLLSAYDFLSSGFILPVGYRPLSINDGLVGVALPLNNDEGGVAMDSYLVFYHNLTAMTVETPYVNGTVTFLTDDPLPSA